MRLTRLISVEKENQNNYYKFKKKIRSTLIYKKYFLILLLDLHFEINFYAHFSIYRISKMRITLSAFTVALLCLLVVSIEGSPKRNRKLINKINYYSVMTFNFLPLITKMLYIIIIN